MNRTMKRAAAFCLAALLLLSLCLQVPLQVRAEDTADSSAEQADYVYTAVFTEDFETEGWEERAHSYAGIKVSALDDNYTNKVAAPTEDPGYGELVWQVTSDSVIESLKIDYCGRNIIGTTLNIHVSADDGATWELVKDNGGGDDWQNAQSVVVDGKDSAALLVKVEMSGGALYNWACLDSITLSIGKAPVKEYVYSAAVTEDFETEGWEERVHSYAGIKVSALDDNYTNKVAAPTEDPGYGELVWKVTSDSVIESLKIDYCGRNIIGTTLNIHVSADDGATWELVKDNGGGEDWQNAQSVVVDGKDSAALLVKVEMSGGAAYNWACLDSITLSIGKEPVKEYVYAEAFTEDFETEGWEERAHSYANIKVSSLDENFTNQVAAPTEDPGYGELVWKVSSADGSEIESLKIDYYGRSIVGTVLKLYVSDDDGATWELVQDNGGGEVWQSPQTVVAGDIGSASALVKVEMSGGAAYNWACLDGITIYLPFIEGVTDSNPTDQVDSVVETWNIGGEDGDYGLTGSYRRETVDTTAGNIHEAYDVIVIPAGETLSFQLPASVGVETNLAVELREIHLREDNDVAYTVSLNGEMLQERTVTPVSEGPIHYWINLPKEQLMQTNTIEISNTGSQDVRIHKVWFYENFEALMVEEDVYKPLEVVLFSPKLSYSDRAADLQKLRDLKSQYSGYEMYEIAIAFDIFYMKLEEKELYEQLDYLMGLSAEAEIPLYLDLNSWWSGTSDGMDGEGGFWKDITNQQIIYDPDNVNGQGVWQLSTPNMWSNTPWLSLNNARYNEIRNEKLEKVSAYIAAKKAEYAAKGTPVEVSIFMENEPIYWAYRHYNKSTVSGRADLSYLVIQAAKADGVDLDPTDGLNAAEQLWLFRNIGDYMEAEGAAVRSGLGSDAVVITDGQVILPDSQLSENAFSHIQATTANESQEIGGEWYPFWEAHLSNNLRLGLEEYNLSILTDTYMDYIVARGTYANVNIERSGTGNFKMLSFLYGYGADNAIIFNYYEGDQALIKAVDAPLATIRDSVAARSRNLWIACRADVERLLVDLEDCGSNARYQEAKAAYENGRYETAYDILMEVSTTGALPVQFAISGEGKLLDYPVTVKVPSGEVVTVTLYEAGDKLKFAVAADSAVSIQVTWEGVTGYTLTDCGNGIYEMTKGGSGSGAAAVTAQPYTEKDYPDAFQAYYVKGSGSSIHITSQDGEISEYVNSVELKLAEGCTISREMDGDETTRQTVELSALRGGDAVFLTLNADDEVTSIRAIYGDLEGRVVSIEYPVVDGNEGLSNPYITVKKEDGTTMRLEICAKTTFNYPTMTGSNMQTSDLTDYGLQPGDKIRISYSPYTWEDMTLKALKIYKNDYHKNVLQVTFEDLEFGDAYSVENVYICSLDSNYTNKVATAQDKSAVGEIIWKIQQDGDAPVSEMLIDYGARSIMGTALRMYLSEDGGETWTLIRENSDDGNFSSIQSFLVEDIAANTVLVKVELDSVGTGDPDTWSSLDQISIRIPSADLLAAQAVDALILEIGTVTLDSKEAIDAAQEAYDALTDAQKEIVENDDILREAQASYAALLAEQEKPGEEQPTQPGGEEKPTEPGEEDATQPGDGATTQPSGDGGSDDPANTADPADPILWITLMLLCGIGAAAVVLQRKKLI